MTVGGIDISPGEVRIITEIFRKHVPDREVWAVGSRVQGTAWRYSDLDLAVIGERPLPFPCRGAMAEDFSESDLPFRVDILDWATTSESFRRRIEVCKIVVQPVSAGSPDAQPAPHTRPDTEAPCT